MTVSLPQIFRNRTTVLAIVGVLVLGGILFVHSLGNNHLDDQAIAATGTHQASSNNKTVKGATTVAANDNKSSGTSATNQAATPANVASSTNGVTPTQSSSTASTKQVNQSQSTGSTQTTLTPPATPSAPAQPTITFSADACYATATNAAGDLLVLAVQDGPTVDTSHRGAGVAEVIVPASGTLTLTTGAPFDEGTTYSIAQIKDSQGNLITQKVAPLANTCS